MPAGSWHHAATVSAPVVDYVVHYCCIFVSCNILAPFHSPLVNIRVVVAWIVLIVSRKESRGAETTCQGDESTWFYLLRPQHAREAPVQLQAWNAGNASPPGRSRRSDSRAAAPVL